MVDRDPTAGWADRYAGLLVQAHRWAGAARDTGADRLTGDQLASIAARAAGYLAQARGHPGRDHKTAALIRRLDQRRDEV